MRRVELLRGALVLTAVLLASRPVAGQSIVEGHIGKLWFVDESAIEHTVAAGSARVFLANRVAVGPEFTYMWGPGDDRDWTVTGNVTFDLGGAAWRVMPYAIAGAGVMHSSNVLNNLPISGWEGAVSFGGGARITMAGQWFIAPEYRMGWEPHWRVGVSIGLLR